MPESPKTRLAKMKKRLAIPRDLYLAAIMRQEHRALARRTDPRRPAEMLIMINKLKNQYLVARGEPPEPLPVPELVNEPDPVVFDTMEQIMRDDALIAAYLAEYPNERRLSNARGHTPAELLKYWFASPEGQKYHEHFSRVVTPELIEIRDRILTEGA